MAYADMALGAGELGQEASHDDLFRLGLCFATGQGAPMDLVSAHKWFNLAALRGNDEAKQRRRELSDIMSGSEIAAAQRAAREWLGRAH
jgi:uncharacterized protein